MAEVDVLHVVTAFYPTRGGIEVLVENLIGTLGTTSHLTHAVLAPTIEDHHPRISTHDNHPVFRIFAPDPPTIQSTEESTRELIQVYHSSFALTLLNTRKLFSELKPKIIHIHGFSNLGVSSSRAASSLKIPLIHHVHGGIGWGIPTFLAKRLLQADRLIAVSEYVRTSVCREIGPRENISLIRNALPDSLWVLGNLGEHRRISNSPCISMVGRLEAPKGFDRGLRAIAPLVREFPSLKVNIVGVGHDQQTLRNLSTRLGIAHSVSFHGRLENEETLKLLRDSTCVLVPSTQIEGFSLVSLESAFLSVPVVATRVGGLPETVQDGVTGTIVDPGDLAAMTSALRTYLSNPTLAKLHGNAARERALREFTLERMAAEIDAVHISLLSEKHRSSA